MLNKLLKVARLQFLIVGLALFMLGALWAVLLGASFSLLRLLLGYLIILPAQLSVHFSNDYFDVASDRPGGSTLVSGGGGVLLAHPELRGPVRWIAIALILFSLAMGMLFIQLYSYPLWTMGFVLLGNLIGWYYSAPPLRLCSRGLGELSYAFAAGSLIPGMGYFVMRGHLDLDAVFFLLPLTLYGLASILTVEIPDMEDDRLGNKRTWVARWGRGFAFTAVGCLLVTATAYFFIFPQLSQRQIPLNLHVLGLFSLLPLGPGILGMVKRPRERKPSARIATWIVVTLAVFAIFVDLYLFYQATR